MKTLKQLQYATKTALKLDQSIPSTNLIAFLSEIQINAASLSSEISDSDYVLAFDHISKKYSQIQPQQGDTMIEQPVQDLTDYSETLMDETLSVNQLTGKPNEPQDESSGSLVTQEPEQSLTIPEVQALIIQTIQSAPEQLRKSLINTYASEAFQSANDLIGIKQLIDKRIDEYLLEELTKSNTAQTQKWNNILTSYEDQSTQEAAKRQEFFQQVLSDLDSKIAQSRLTRTN